MPFFLIENTDEPVAAVPALRYEPAAFAGMRKARGATNSSTTSPLLGLPAMPHRMS